MDPRGAQVRPKGGQGTPRWSQEKPQGAPGDPEKAQDDPKGNPRGAQSDPKRFKSGEGGCPRGPKHEKVDCSTSLENQRFLHQNKDLEVNCELVGLHVGSCWLMLSHLELMIVHFGSR